ncbi:hypothetical protein ACI4CU_27480, partial [Klebsiella pneumoniae]|uniref:hypothetical protein n=1 Tax=Klebsiella pneumoniae TaxID=573 RepID=UPI003853864F
MMRRRAVELRPNHLVIVDMVALLESKAVYLSYMKNTWMFDHQDYQLLHWYSIHQSTPKLFLGELEVVS